MSLVSERTSRLAPGSVLATDAGALRVRTARPHQRGWLVHFEGVADRDGAEALRGLVLRAPAEPSAAGELWVHEVIGAAVVLPDGTPVGRVEAVQPNPAADLLVLDGGALVPVVFVVDEQRDGTRLASLVIDPPEGLLEL